MGIYDREYYRGETRGSGWFSGVAPACKTIILINVVVFVLQTMSTHDGPLEEWLSATSSGILQHGRIWQLLTATFLHDPRGPMHLLINMLFLWMVGREMESMYGSRDFVAMYLSAAIFSTFCWALTDAIVHGVGDNPMIGASGAVMAVVVLYTLYYPRREVLLFFILPVEMWLLLVIYLFFDAWNLLHGARTQVAVAAHLSGAAYGYFFKTFDLRWSHLPWGRARRPRFRVISPEPREKSVSRPVGPTWSSDPAAVSSKPSTTAVLPEEQLDARLDEVLAKIAREGRAGLTDDENRILQEASQRARNRRSDRI